MQCLCRSQLSLHCLMSGCYWSSPSLSIRAYNKHLYGKYSFKAWWAVLACSHYISLCMVFCSCFPFFHLSIKHGTSFLPFRAEFTKYIVTPALGVSGVGGSMAVFGAFDAIVSIVMQIACLCFINWNSWQNQWVGLIW